MARCITFELILSDAAVAAVNRYKMNVAKIATQAVYDELRYKIEVERAVELRDNAELREEVRALKEQLSNIYVPVMIPSLKR